MNIVLLGYMASGKSIIAKELAKKTNEDFIDLDTYIEEKENLKISEIFKNKGEIYFRKIETSYLKEILNKKNGIILAVGGGTPCYANNMQIILKNSISIYLKASTDTIYNRILSEKNKRPLVKEISNEKLKEFISKHIFERNNFYNKATVIISVNDKSIQEIISEILLQISNGFVI